MSVCKHSQLFSRYKFTTGFKFYLSVSSVAHLHVPVVPRGAVCLGGVVDVALGDHGAGGARQAAVKVLHEDGHLTPDKIDSNNNSLCVVVPQKVHKFI